MRVFDRRLVRRRRERFAATFEAHGFLVREVAERLVERLEDVRRDFPRTLLLGGHGGLAGRMLEGRFGIELLVTADSVPGMLEASAGRAVVADEELLPFAPGSLDAALGVMTLHWVNDLPGTLAQLHACLVPDGLLMLAFAGGETLVELRQVLWRRRSTARAVQVRGSRRSPTCATRVPFCSVPASRCRWSMPTGSR